MKRVRLLWELGWAHILLWVAGVNRTNEATPQVHLYLADLHFRLADEYERLHRRRLALRHRQMANSYAASGAEPEPPRAAAMAMPVPRSPIFTDARGTYVPEPSDEPDDVAERRAVTTRCSN
jgi:hypothetical protein